ncbi:hypothetical protein EBME_1283 [bacterium endosymbiont of Mortierella elongata FMR23-6]|nr:hypothetical protein EBME_1283 [bacterium endosymbiont of Mortierella elongata FMR23-6]
MSATAIHRLLLFVSHDVPPFFRPDSASSFIIPISLSKNMPNMAVLKLDYQYL